MKKLFAIAALVAATLAVSSPNVLAVDNTISPLCRGDAAADNKLYCDTIASNLSLASGPSHPPKSCPAGSVEYPPRSGVCTPL